MLCVESIGWSGKLFLMNCPIFNGDSHLSRRSTNVLDPGI
jgi:hypothetical protein